MLRAGDMLGPYEVRTLLGAGGMGEVYRAHDKRLRRDVAIKVLPVELVRDVTRRRRFAQEAQSASALNHPNIASIFDVNLDSDPPYIVGELVEGDPLHTAIGGRPMPVRKLFDLAAQIADGLAAAHRASIVHRDLKPANILINREGRVKIVDFGLAFQVSGGPIGEDEDTAFLTVTETGKVVGTVQYMSPEQARGQPLDTRCDIFSFGVILYEMASGQRPFQGDSPVETLSAIITQEPPPLDSSVPLPLRWAIDRCLAKEPERRYQATGDLCSDLHQWRDHLGDLLTGSVAAPMGRLGIASPGSGRRWLVFAALAGATLFGATAAVLLASKPVPIAARQFRPLATGSAFETSAAWSPDGLSIAYQGLVDGVFQIFTRAVDSAGPLQVTHCSRPCTGPAWSADGARLFFLMDQSIWSIGAEGGEMDRVIEGANGFGLSLRGDLLAFVRQEFNPTHASVWLSSPPGAAPVRYSPGPFRSRLFQRIEVGVCPRWEAAALLRQHGRHAARLGVLDSSRSRGIGPTVPGAAFAAGILSAPRIQLDAGQSPRGRGSLGAARFVAHAPVRRRHPQRRSSPVSGRNR